MFNKIKTVIASAAIGFAALAAAPTAAQADSIYFSMGSGGRIGIGVESNRYEPVRDHRWRGGYRQRTCTNVDAVRKASRMGLRRAQVVRAAPRSVTVAGFNRYGRDRITFARPPGCPVIR